MRWNGKRLTKNLPKILPQRRTKKKAVDVTERDFAPRADGATDGVLTTKLETIATWHRRRRLHLDQLCKVVEHGPRDESPVQKRKQ